MIESGVIHENHESFKVLEKKCKETDRNEEIEGSVYADSKGKKLNTIDLVESDDKHACIITGPNEFYSKGSEVFMSYGRYSNRQLLSGYGFLLTENSYNYAKIKFHILELRINPSFLHKTDSSKTFVFKLKLGSISKSKIKIGLIQTIRSINWNPD